MRPIERKLIIAGGVCGMAVFAFPLGRTLLDGTVFKPLEPWLWNAAALLLVGLGVYCLRLLWLPTSTRGKPGASEADEYMRRPLRWLFLVVLVTYYWPLFVIENELMAFAMVGPAHGFQYLVIMSYVAAKKREATPEQETKLARTPLGIGWGRLLLFAGGTVLFAFASYQLGARFGTGGTASGHSRELGQFVTSAVLSVTLIHYWVDARMWKMSQPDSRQFIRSKLPFLF